MATDSHAPRRIDSHQHFWRYDPRYYDWITNEMSALKRDFLPEDLIPELRANNLDGCVAVQANQSEGETAFLLELAERHSEIKGVVGWVDLRSWELQSRLAHFSRFKKLRGLRHIVQSEADDRFMLCEDFVAGIAALDDFGLTYDILIYPRQLQAAIALVRKFPEQKFVVDHMAKPLIRSRQISPWAEQMREVAKSQNVYCKVSGLITEADWHNWRESDLSPYLDVVMESFGPHRMMFGSDWPVCLLAGTYQQVKRLVMNYIQQLPDEQQAGILGLNAIDFYNLNTSD
jgi:L-fuconolactonase